MNRISSFLTLPYKIFLFLISGILLLFGILLFTRGHMIVAIMILIVSSVLLWVAKLLKSIRVNNREVVCKGMFSKSVFKVEEIKGIGSIFLFFYIKLNNKKRIFFLSTFADEIKSLTKSSESAEESIFNRIKNNSLL